MPTYILIVLFISCDRSAKKQVEDRGLEAKDQTRPWSEKLGPEQTMVWSGPGKPVVYVPLTHPSHKDLHGSDDDSGVMPAIKKTNSVRRWTVGLVYRSRQSVFSQGESCRFTPGMTDY